MDCAGWPQYSRKKYAADQRDAEQAGRGIWKGSYVEPWLYGCACEPMEARLLAQMTRMDIHKHQHVQSLQHHTNQAAIVDLSGSSSATSETSPPMPGVFPD